MPAFTFQTNKLNMSLAYDTLTVYFKFNQYTPTGRQSWGLAVTACHQLNFVMVPEVEPSPDAENFTLVAREVQGRLATDRFIHRDDDDHDLYHHDVFNKESVHSHMKFIAELTRAQLSLILDIYVDHKLITSDEKIAMLTEYDARFALTRKQFDMILGGQFGLDSSSDYQKINAFIQGLEDNDLLDDLHNYLLTDKFDILRSNPAGESSLWQGTNAAGEVVKTSQLWAMIEKSITLQMGHNVETGCRFTPDVAMNWAAEFRTHRFFAVKHQLNGVADRARDAESPSVEAFRNCDTHQFDSEYLSHFKRSI